MFWKTSLIAALSALTMVPAYSQAPIRFVTGSAPGGGVDITARIVATEMASALNRTIIVENKPGAAYNIAADHVAKAAPDGNTLLVTFNVHPVAGALNPKLSYDPVKDFRAVGMIGTTPYVIVANPAVPGDDLKQMIERSKTDKRSLSFGSIGNGTPQHLMMERLKGQTGADIRMIHYKGVAGLTPDLIGGHIDFSLLTISSAESQVKNGRLKAIAVTSAQRLPQFQDAPTVTELGYKDFVTDGWYALFLPAKTPDDIVKTYNEALNKALQAPAVVEQLRTLGATVSPGAPEVLDRQIESDFAMWTKVVKDNNIKAE